HRSGLAAAIHLELELQPVAFVERRDPRPLDGRNVNEGVGLAVVALDETEALHRVEELDGAARLLTGELPLRASLGPFDRHRLAFDPQVRRRNPAAAIDERELERLTVSEVRETRLLDRRDVDEHVLTAVIADDEAEALLRVEEFDDALAFANDLRRHSATAAAAEPAATAATAAIAAATAAAESAAVAAVATTAAAAESATVTVAAAAAKAAAFLESAVIAKSLFAEAFAFIPTATATVSFAPSIETHNLPNSLARLSSNQRARAKWRNRSWRVIHSRTVHAITAKIILALVTQIAANFDGAGKAGGRKTKAPFLTLREELQWPSTFTRKICPRTSDSPMGRSPSIPKPWGSSPAATGCAWCSCRTDTGTNISCASPRGATIRLQISRRCSPTPAGSSSIISPASTSGSCKPISGSWLRRFTARAPPPVWSAPIPTATASRTS